MRAARTAGSGTGMGSLKNTIMPSPVKRSRVPSWARMSRPISRWYSARRPISSSGSAVSAKAVKPRRSRNTTVISRRWLLSGSSAPPATISSASWGEKNRLSRDSRSSWATCSATRRSSVSFHRASSRARLRVHVAQPLLLQTRADPRPQQHRLEGLREVVLGAELDAPHHALELIEGRDHEHGNVAQGRVALHALEELVAVEAGHHHVEEGQVDGRPAAERSASRAAAPSAAVLTT